MDTVQVPDRGSPSRSVFGPSKASVCEETAPPFGRAAARRAAVQDSVHVRARWLGVVCFLLATSVLAQKAGPKSSKPNSSQSNPASKEQSVEVIAEAARQSVVVISHFGRDGKEDGLGAGFVVSSNGLIATSLHVIGEARPISVQLANGTRYEATEVHAWDRKLDLAVIRITVTGKLTSLPLGDSDTLKQGTPVVAIGNPLGLERSIVQGVVSAKRDFDGVEMIQLAIPVEPGNSGGPLLDMQGRVHGLLTLKSAVTPNLGFAMPVNALKSLLAKPNPVPMSRWLSLVTLNPREWTPVFGARWTQKGGRILVDTPGVGFGGRSLCLSAKPVPPRPFEIAVMVRLEDESGAAGLVFASDGGDKHYGFYPSAGQLRLTRFDGPVVDNWTILQQAATAHYHPGEWNMLKVRVEEGQILCHVNGHLVIESTDNALKGGKVGLAKFRDTKAAFRNFEVGTNLAALNPSASEVAAVTEEVEKLGAAPDPAALAKLQEHRELTQSILSDRAGKLEQEATQLRRLAVTLHRQSVQDDLVKLFKAPEEQIDLFRAALLVSKLDNADLDIEAYRAQLDEMGRELASRLPAKAGDGAKLAALTNYLFAENGFHGSRTDFHNRANSYINEVLDDREGLPITLSVLFLELARRIELDNVAGVSLPGHFVVGYAPRNGGQQLLDIFENGKNLTRTEANELVISFTGSPLTDDQLKPARKRDIIIRMLQNLLRLAQRQESTADSLRYLDVIVALAPEAPLERYSRALLRLRAGNPAGAKEDFKWLLDNQPSEIDVDQLMQLYRTL